MIQSEKKYAIPESLLLQTLQVLDVATHPLVGHRDVNALQDALRRLDVVASEPPPPTAA